MKNSGKNQLALLVDSENSAAVLDEVQTIFNHHYRLEAFEKIENVHSVICQLFEGKFSGYRKCNTEYHNLKHTQDAFLAAARLIDGKILSGGALDECVAVNLLIAALLHDTGYIQEDFDSEGTGAKYTAVHVKRSIEFAERNSPALKLSDSDLMKVSSFISCTGLKSDHISTLSGDDLAAGCILGTADLIGQMSDRAYLEKLLFLYYEFSEAGLEGDDTTFEFLRKTLGFYESTMARLDYTLMRSYNYALDHFKVRFAIHENLYMTAIEKQMEYLKLIIEDEQSNFRTKLKRLDVERIELQYRTGTH